MQIDPIQPTGWAKPKGYSNGVLVTGSTRTLHVAGQIAWDAEAKLVGQGEFPVQFTQALRNVVVVVEAAGGKADQLVSMTVYVTDKQAYLAALPGVGEAWRSIIGRHYPAMALVEVADLLEDGAMVEIAAVAALP
ncbi:MAG TPA: RidA family protein [Planctomycetota bacterium]|nr:RidA family protein [Planctomycetota bacterium]HRV79921.1 RidA family protein [Planctomycetota bacterium]